eukprot:30147-Pelagomonas_calceolata.AAC.1
MALASEKNDLSLFPLLHKCISLSVAAVLFGWPRMPVLVSAGFGQPPCKVLSMLSPQEPE